MENGLQLLRGRVRISLDVVRNILDNERIEPASDLKDARLMVNLGILQGINLVLTDVPGVEDLQAESAALFSEIVAMRDANNRDKVAP